MRANIYHFILKCPRSSELFLLSSESGDLQTNIIGHFFFLLRILFTLSLSALS